MFELIVAVALVIANGFFVASEFALVRLRLTEATEMEDAGRGVARSARHAVEHLDAYLAACQLGITLASIGLGVVGKPAFEALLHPIFAGGASIAGFGVAATLAFLIITLLHVVVGELAPKSLAISRTRRTVLLIAPWMRAFYLATKPVVDLFNAMGNLLLKPFGIPPASEAGHAPHSEHELRALLRQSHHAGLIGRDDLELTESSFAFGDRRAGEIMTPRAEIDFVTTSAKLREVARVALTSGHTRLPVCEPDGGLDAPAGVIHVKDLLEAILEKSEGAPALLARPLARVAESTLLSELLRDLRHQRQHIALVADDHGTTTGLLTLEDILEALVGEIEDEFDIEVSTETARNGTVAVMRDGAPIQLLAEELRIAVSEPHEATIGRHLVEVIDLDDTRITHPRIQPGQP